MRTHANQEKLTEEEAGAYIEVRGQVYLVSLTGQSSSIESCFLNFCSFILKCLCGREFFSAHGVSVLLCVCFSASCLKPSAGV